MKEKEKRTAGSGGRLARGLLLTVLFMVFMKPLLTLMNTPSDIFADAYAYIMIVSGGIQTVNTGFVITDRIITFVINFLP